MMDVLKNELDYMMLMTHESRLMLMNDIRQSLKCKSCYEDFRLKFLLNIHPIHLENILFRALDALFKLHGLSYLIVEHY